MLVNLYFSAVTLVLRDFAVRNGFQVCTVLACAAGL